MLTDKEIRNIAQTVVDKTKQTARVDTGALKRSISFTYVDEVVIFRMIYYGQFNNNAELEKNARKLIPRGVSWKIIYTKFGGQTYEVGRTFQGRATQKSLFPILTRQGTDAARALIAKILNRGKKKD